MKKLHLLLLGLTICLFSACHNKLWDAIDDLDVRVARLLGVSIRPVFP